MSSDTPGCILKEKKTMIWHRRSCDAILPIYMYFFETILPNIFAVLLKVWLRTFWGTVFGRGTTAK
jgi:hypothetical protein